MPARFDFVQDGASAAIRFTGEPILDLDCRVLFHGDRFIASNQRMRPDAGPEVASVPLFGCMDRKREGITEVRYEALAGSDELTLHVTPVLPRSHQSLLQKVTETCTLHVRLDGDRFVWTQTLETRFHETLDLAALEEAGARFYHFRHQNGQPGVFLQFADPAPVGSSGPAVPMQRDWRGVFEPNIGPDTFRQKWRRRYVGIALPNPDGSMVRCELNKAKWHHLIQDNRRARPCDPRGTLWLIRDDGGALALTCDAPSHYHHVCEWGIDFHFWVDLEPFLDERGRVPAGTCVRASVTTQLEEPDTVNMALAGAEPLELTDQERALADRPAFEQPYNHFVASVLDRLDARPWLPTSEGCAWDRAGGRHKQEGCLIIRNRYSRVGEWRAVGIGPSYWANPLVAGGRYRLRAQVRLEDFISGLWKGSGPRVGVEWLAYDGPGALATARRIDAGLSAPLVRPDRPAVECMDWTLIELITPPCPPYVLSAELILRLEGVGTATFAEVRWEMLEE